MNESKRGRRAEIRVWVVAAAAWEPASVFDEPPTMRPLFPAVEEMLSREEAAAFVAGFNEQMLADGGRRWAIARRVVAREDEMLAARVGLCASDGVMLGACDVAGASDQVAAW